MGRGTYMVVLPAVVMAVVMVGVLVVVLAVVLVVVQVAVVMLMLFGGRVVFRRKEVVSRGKVVR